MWTLGRPVAAGTQHHILFVSAVRNKSNYRPLPSVKQKLKAFVETGQVMPAEYDAKSKTTTRPNAHIYTPQKLTAIFRSLFVGKLQDSTGNIVNVHNLTVDDVKPSSPKSIEIFRALLGARRVDRKPVSRKILLSLLGVSSQRIKDSHAVTKIVLRFLEQDNDSYRAEQLCKLVGGESGVVAMNAVMQWHLERANIKAAFKSYNNRKKWGIPATAYTYTILFDGIAKCSEWGSVTLKDCERYVQIFQSIGKKQMSVTFDANGKKGAAKQYLPAEDVNCTIEHFNACLDVLVRNFDDNQAAAWDFFDFLIPDKDEPRPTLIPTCQTFTILLNGVLKKAQIDAEKVNSNSALTKEEKAEQLTALLGTLVSTANDILAKVLAGATPPIPPTKEAAKLDPDLVKTYDERARRQRLDVDSAFVAVYVSCFINGVRFPPSLKLDMLGNIRYGLTCLATWCPVVPKMMQYASESTDAIDCINDPGVDKDYLNPQVIFPPSILSKNKTRAKFSGKQKPLVDLTRLTNAEARIRFRHNQYVASKGRFGEKATQATLQRISQPKSPFNKFLLLVFMDGLLKLGKFSQFYLVVWFSLISWTPVDLDSTKLVERYKKQGVEQGLLPLTDLTIGTKSRVEFDCVDHLMVENFIYKISENFPYRGLLMASRLTVEIFSALVAANHPDVSPRQKTIDAIWATFNADIHHFNDSNYNRILLEYKKKNLINRPPKKLLTDEQIMMLVPVLDSFMEALTLHAQYGGHLAVQDRHIDSYNKIITRIYESQWLPDNSDKHLDAHMLIIRLGIRHYVPVAKRNLNPDKSYSEIAPSIQFALDKYPQIKAELTEDEIENMRALKMIEHSHGSEERDTSRRQLSARQLHRSIPGGSSCK